MLDWFKPKTRILIVCTANVTRSPFFAALLERKLQDSVSLKGRRFQVRSCGIEAQRNKPAHMVARLLSQRHGLDLRYHASRPCDEKLLRKADLVLAMERRHRDQLREWFPQWSDKFHTVMEFGWTSDEEPEDIPDPTGLEMEDYTEFTEIAEREADRIVYELIHREWTAA